LRTGADAQQVTEIRRNIISCLPHTSGFIIYSTQNAVYARGTSDLPYPFIYEEIRGSAGILTPQHVASDTTYGSHFAWTKAGMHKIDADAARLLFPEATAFLTCGYIEDYINNWDGQERIGTDIFRPNFDVFHE